MNTKTTTLAFTKSISQKLWHLVALAAAALLMLAGSQLALAGPVSAADGDEADIEGSVCAGIGLSVQSQDKDCEAESKEAADRIDNTIARALDIFSIIAGAAAVFMLIYAGIRYIVSGGKEAGMKAARSSMIYAIVGLVLVALSQTLVYFVFDAVSTSNGGG